MLMNMVLESDRSNGNFRPIRGSFRYNKRVMNTLLMEQVGESLFGIKVVPRIERPYMFKHIRAFFNLLNLDEFIGGL